MDHLIAFLRSIWFFILLFFKARKVSIIFYYPNHFNRSIEGNPYFKPLIDVCKNNNISYLIFEEPDYKFKYNRSTEAIPFDFVYAIVVLVRKLKSSSSNYINLDKKIGIFLSNNILSNLIFQNFITISQSGLSLFRGINESAKLFDLQHGIIYSNKDSYFNSDSIVSDNILQNRVNILTFGPGFLEILKYNDKKGYYLDYAKSIGFPITFEIKRNVWNSNILVSLQFTSDHSEYENNTMCESINNIILENPGSTFYLRSHPRNTDKRFLYRLLNNKNAIISDKELKTDLKSCSLHLSVYSTTIFEAALLGIPTLILNLPKIGVNFFKEFSYPIQSVYISDFVSNFDLYSKEVNLWVRNYYQKFDHKTFIKLIKK